jgi:heme-degrading monooxygenase HmoA
MAIPFGVVQDMPGVTESEYLMVERNLGPDRPPGLLAHVSGPTDEGWRIVNVWQSEEAYRSFVSERLLRAAGLAAAEEGFDPGKAAGFRIETVVGKEMPF